MKLHAITATANHSAQTKTQNAQNTFARLLEQTRTARTANVKDRKETGIETAECAENKRELYIEAMGYEGLSDEEIKADILGRYGHGANLTESEFRKMAQELITAGIGGTALVLAMHTTPGVVKEHKAVVEMSRNGNNSKAALEMWRMANPPSDETLNWPEYYTQRRKDYILRGADPGSIETVEKIIRAITLDGEMTV